MTQNMGGLIRPRSTDRITISGMTGQGKTVLARYLCTLYEPHLFIYDPMNQYRAFKVPDYRYIPETDSQAEFEAVCRQLHSRENLVFVIEESELYLEQGAALGPYASKLIYRGRNWGIGIVAVTRRIQMLSKKFFDLSQKAFFFKCGLTSRDYIANLIGKPLLQKIVELPPYHFLYYNVETEEALVRHLELEGTRPHIAGEERISMKELSLKDKLVPPREEPSNEVTDQRLAGKGRENV